MAVAILSNRGSIAQEMEEIHSHQDNNATHRPALQHTAQVGHRIPLVSALYSAWTEDHPGFASLGQPAGGVIKVCKIVMDRWERAVQKLARQGWEQWEAGPTTLLP